MRLIGFDRADQSGVSGCRAGVPLLTGALAVGAIVFGMSELSRKETAGAMAVAQTLTVVQAVESVKADFQTGLSEGRGYYLSADASDLDRSNAAFDRIGPEIVSLRERAARSPGENGLLDRLEPLLTERIGSLRHVMTLPYVPVPATPDTLARRDRVRALTRDILADLDAITAEARVRLERRQAEVAWSVRLLTWDVVASGMIAATSFFVMIAQAIGRERERRHMAELARLNVALEARVRDRTAELARSEARQRDYFNNSPIGMFVALLREDGQVVHEDVNPAFVAIYGYSRGDMIGKTLRDLWPGAFANDVEQRIAACVAADQPAQYTVQRDLRGGVRTLDVILVPFHDENGPSRRVLGCLRDVTEKVELERQVVAHLAREAEAAELERVLFRNSPDVLALIRVEGDPANPVFTYEACSPAIECVTGIRPDAIIGRRPEEVLATPGAEGVNARLRRCILERKTILYSTKTGPAAGGRDLEGSATPVFHPVTGRVHRIVVMARDVTERKRIEETLRQTQKREALGRVTSGVAHDVNNVLAVISNGYDTIEVASDDPVVRDCVSIGRSAVDHAAGLVRHLLAFARQHPSAAAVIDTSAALAEIIRLCRHALDDDVTLTLDADAKPWAILVDRHLLQAALLNLVANARDAMPDGGNIAITARNVPANATPDDPSMTLDTDHVAICVADSGFGMSADHVSRATEPFFTTKEGTAGAGLGLAMVDGFIGQSNGRLRIASEPGRGTAVTMYLPRAAESTTRPAPSDAVPSRGEDGRARTILVVDDNAALLRSTALLLRTLGYTVLTATDRDMALALAARHRELDLVMTDIAMRGGSGIVLAERLAALYPGLPVIFVTGFAGEEHVTGGRVILRKPVAMRDMLAAFDAALGARGAEVTLAAR